MDAKQHPYFRVDDCVLVGSLQAPKQVGCALGNTCDPHPARQQQLLVLETVVECQLASVGANYESDVVAQFEHFIQILPMTNAWANLERNQDQCGVSRLLIGQS